MMEEAKNHVLALIGKAANAELAGDAVRFAEAAGHAAHALIALNAALDNPAAGSTSKGPETQAATLNPAPEASMNPAAPADNAEGAPAAVIATDHAA